MPIPIPVLGLPPSGSAFFGARAVRRPTWRPCSPVSPRSRIRSTGCTEHSRVWSRIGSSRRSSTTMSSTRPLTTREGLTASSFARVPGTDQAAAMYIEPVTRSLLRLLAYYVALVLVALVLGRYSPAVRDAVALATPFGDTARQPPRGLEGGGEAGEAGAVPTPGRAVPAVATALAMAGALALVIPVAWVYMLTKRHQGWDPSVVQTVILLPIAVAGIVVLVGNSLARAFSLAGLAAAVRFRNSLKDTKDAVYVFLAMAVGLAAGVQALALGFVVSVIFNGAVVALWIFNVGDIYAGEPRPSFTREFRISDPERLDGLLVVQAHAAGPAQEIVEATLRDLTRAWKLTQRVPGEGGRATLTYQVRLKKKTSPAALVAAVTTQGSP